MDKSQVPLEADLQFDEVVLSDRAFNTDPSQILIESSDPQKLRFRLIEWLAEAPNRKVNQYAGFTTSGWLHIVIPIKNETCLDLQSQSR